MCTAVSYNSGNHYFGRNLDYEHDFGEQVVITPSNYKFEFSDGTKIYNHHSLIGMALVQNGYPLYFDATNNMGLSMAGLNFPDNAHYFKPQNDKCNIASYEFIPWILTQCQSVEQAKKLLENVSITDTAFSPHMPPTPLHWIISDKISSITVEQTKSGMSIYDNPIGVLTNSPEFSFHTTNLTNYMHSTAMPVQNLFSSDISLKPHSRGMGGIGIPGDLSSASRFVRAAFVKLNSVSSANEADAVNQFFHILYSVYQQRGCVRLDTGCEITNYSSCCNTTQGIYYYTTYNNFCINGINMHNHNLNSCELISFDLIKKQKINII